jgi:hypothetical protein
LVREMMTTQTLVLEDIRERSLEEILWNVVKDSTRIVIRMPDGEEVVIELKPRLEPLPVLEGYVPEGWKDAVYAENG